MNMYNKLNNVDKYDGQELIEALIYVCNNVHNDIINYNTYEHKVYEILTKMCIDIRSIIYNDIDVVYCDIDEEEQLRYMCEKYGYANIIYNTDIVTEYWYIIDDDVYQYDYKDIDKVCSTLLETNECTDTNENTKQIRWTINYYWDKIDYDYNEEVIR